MQEIETLENVFKEMRKTLIHPKDKQYLEERWREFDNLRRSVKHISSFSDVRKRKVEMEKRYTRPIRARLYEQIKSILDEHTKVNKAGCKYLMQKHMDRVFELCLAVQDQIQYEREFSYVWTDPCRFDSIERFIQSPKTSDLAASWFSVENLMHILKRESELRPDMNLTVMLFAHQFPERCMTAPLRKLPMDLFKYLSTFIYSQQKGRVLFPCYGYRS